MAQNITIMGASYSDVPAVVLPKTGGGTAKFTDTTPTTATESDVKAGEVFIKSDGSQATGSMATGSAAGPTSMADVSGYSMGHNSITNTVNILLYDIPTTPTVRSGYIDSSEVAETSRDALCASAIKYSPTLTENGATVTAPAGYYPNDKTKTIASGTEGTPTATKGTVTNHAVTVTPTVTNTAGYITGSTKNGTAVTVSASELVSGNLAITANGNNIDVTNYETVSVNVPTGGGTSKNAQTVQQSNTRITATAYTKACGDITVSKTGTYDVYWTAYRTSASGTWGTQLYINGTAYGTAQTTFTNSYYQAIHLSNVSLTANQTVSVYGRSRGSNYYLYVGQLTIIEA